MNKKDSVSEKAFSAANPGQALRRQAERIVRGKGVLSPESINGLSLEETRQLLHELQVHQIELEMQNEELRRSQTELDAARARYFDLYDLAPVGYCTVNEKGRILEINLTAASLLGVARDKLVNQPITRFIHNEDQTLYYLHRKELFETGELQTCELRMMKKDGTAFWASLSATAEQDADGAALLRIVISDITNRKQVEAALLESEARYTIALNAASDGIWDWRVPDGSAYMSPLYYSLLGYEDGEFPASYASWRSLVHPEDIGRVERILQQSVEKGEGFAFDHRMKVKSGEWLWVSARGKAIELDAEGKALRMVGTLSNITDRKLAEALLNQTLAQSMRRAEEVSALLKSARIVLDYADFGQASRKIFDVCCAITGATAGYVALLSADGQENVVLFLESGGLPCSVSPDLPMPVRGLREQAYRSHETVFENDFWNSRWMSYMPAGHCRLDNVLFAPLEIDGKALGVMGIANKAGGFTDHDQRLVSAFAELVAVSLRNAQTQKSLEEKDKRLREAHDVLEDRVKVRTRDLNRANAQLMAEIEEHQKAAEALQQSEEKYRIVADNTYDWEFWVDPEGEFIYVSPACERITGHSRGEFESDSDLMRQILHPEDLPRYLAHRHTAERNPASEPLTFRIRRPDGQERWIEHLCQPVFDTNGTYLGNRGSNRDVTTRVLSEAQILQGQKKLQAVFDGISEPLTFVDRNMTTQMVNEAAVRYYQYTSPQDVLDRSSCIKSGVKNDLCDRCPIPTAVSGDKQVSFVREGYMDPERVESVTIFPISSENEEHSGAVIRISDITEARMMEKALLRSEKLASIGVLSSGVAHEINNPNNFIMFNIPVLRRYLGAILPIVKAHAAAHADFTPFGMSFEAYERDLFELTDSIEKGSERIKNIVSELKDFSSLEDPVAAAWGNPEQSIAQAVRISSIHLKERVKRLDVDIPEDLPDAFFEARGLEQVIVNLLINAAHAADKEASWIRLKAKIEGEENRHFVIEITDNGCGIDEKRMTKIFDPFFTSKPPGQGTGLGLYVCHNLIQKVRGHIEVNSRVGEGSNFRIKLLCK